MTIKKISLIIWTLIIVALIQTSAVAEVVARHGKGSLEYVRGVRVVRLEGTPSEIGIQHGTLLRDEIQTLRDYFFKEKSNIFGMSVAEIARASKVLEKHIPAQYIEEMRGVAEGSGVDYEEILQQNTFLDAVSAGWVAVKAPQCSNFAALPDASKNGDIVHGRNLDWSSDENLSRANTVFFITPDDGVPFVSLSWVGMVGTLTGMNAEQISMGEMTSMSSGASLEGTPIMIHLRILLEKAKTLDEAYGVLSDLPRTTGYNVLITDGKIGTGYVVEMNATDIFKKGPQDGFLIRTNHYLHPKMKRTQNKAHAFIYGSKKTNSHYRYLRLEQLLNENSGEIDVEKAKSFLGDKFDPLAGKVSGDLSNTIYRESTLQSVVMLPQSGTLYVALTKVPAPDSEYVKLELELSEEGRAE